MYLLGQEPDCPENIGAADGLDLLFRGVGILRQVMEQPGNLMICAIAPIPEDTRHSDGMGDMGAAADEFNDRAVSALDDLRHLAQIVIEHGDEAVGRHALAHGGEAPQVANQVQQSVNRIAQGHIDRTILSEVCQDHPAFYIQVLISLKMMVAFRFAAKP